MTDQWTELERLAKDSADLCAIMEATGEPAWMTQGDLRQFPSEDASFIAAANPAAILELITAARASSVGTNGEAGSEQKPVVTELVEALRPFARFIEAHDGDPARLECRPDHLSCLVASTGEQRDGATVFQILTYGDLRKSRTALSRQAQTGNGEGGA